MSILGLILAVILYRHFARRRRQSCREFELEEGRRVTSSSARSWHREWERQWAEKFRREADRRQRDWERYARRWEREARRHAKHWGKKQQHAAWPFDPAAWHTKWYGAASAVVSEDDAKKSEPSRKQSDAGRSASDARRAEDESTAPGMATPSEEQILRRARRRAAAEVSFYGHLMSYLGVMGFLALINLFTSWYPWFLWPALGWGIGLFSHWMAVFGSRHLKQKYFDPAVEREVRMETISMRTEKQASIDELAATMAHEIRNPIAAAKSLVQQMGEDPRSMENVEYASVALDELDRVERSISHLLKYAKEEELNFKPVNLASVVDAALTELKAKLDAAKVAISRNYIGGPTLIADGEKLRQVFANILDNAIDALGPVTDGRRVDLFIENGIPNRAKVRVRDNGVGIPPEKIDRIFNPFFTTKEKGTGLGMAISKKIVEAHEGTIDVVSEPQHGTEFVVTLPLPH
jgi:signal transduction histidine kinase